MDTQIFINLPVKDLDRSVAFFTRLGFTFNPQFTNENATCMIIGDRIFAMLLVEPFFRTFIKKEICDAHKSTEAIIALSLGSRDAVNDLVDKAVAAGASSGTDIMDQGFMYQRAFDDPDGHRWEIFFMDPGAIQG